MVVFQWNGETYEQECYPFPLKKDNGTYLKVWIALESNLNKTEWMGKEHIVEIKEL